MKRMLGCLLFLLLLINLKAAPPPSLAADGTAALSTFFSEAVARGDVPGIVAIVVGRDQVLYHEAFGTMNAAKSVAMSKDAIFRIASMTKAVTSVGVMMLVEEGKLGLDDEVSKYIPSLKSPQVFSKVDEKAGGIKQIESDPDHIPRLFIELNQDGPPASRRDINIFLEDQPLLDEIVDVVGDGDDIESHHL
jgi:CubicO group peptidase (beta-lactamase class C family)